MEENSVVLFELSGIVDDESGPSTETSKVEVISVSTQTDDPDRDENESLSANITPVSRVSGHPMVRA